MRTAAVVLAAVLAAALPAASEDTRAVLRVDQTGFDYYDVAWTYLGRSVQNAWGSYDFEDAQGRLFARAKRQPDGSIAFELADGTPWRTTVIDANGGSWGLTAQGSVVLLGAKNERGGDTYYRASTLDVTMDAGRLSTATYAEDEEAGD